MERTSLQCSHSQTLPAPAETHYSENQDKGTTTICLTNPARDSVVSPQMSDLRGSCCSSGMADLLYRGRSNSPRSDHRWQYLPLITMTANTDWALMTFQELWWLLEAAWFDLIQALIMRHLQDGYYSLKKGRDQDSKRWNNLSKATGANSWQRQDLNPCLSGFTTHVLSCSARPLVLHPASWKLRVLDFLLWKKSIGTYDRDIKIHVKLWVHVQSWAWVYVSQKMKGKCITEW